jgi:NAD dependent epimerase/dehydratase family enzyme
MAIMRIAIAGSGGLAQHLAHFINQTAHYFIIISRSVSRLTLDVTSFVWLGSNISKKKTA